MHTSSLFHYSAMSLGIKIGVALVMIAAIFVFTSTAVRGFWYAPEEELPQPQAGAQAMQERRSSVQNDSTPYRLRIPRLRVDAHIQHVGLNKEGNMATPTNFRDAGWFKKGPIPGERGSAVIAGHVDNGLGLSGVFKHLSTLQEGDLIEVVSKDFTVQLFEVIDVRAYRYDEVPNDLIFNHSDGARLNLVTCEGDWIKSERTYDMRLVVFTKLVR